MRPSFDPFLQKVEVGFLHGQGFIVLDRDDPPVISWETCPTCGQHDEHWGTLNAYQFVIKARQLGFSVTKVNHAVNAFWANLPRMTDLNYTDQDIFFDK